jgi:hypothetical protein
VIIPAKRGEYHPPPATIKPDEISISHSPKGWTDQELGSAWLERDFEPATAARNKTGGYRLLILDGHNSHTTYRFCSFAEKHKIIVLCLPSHTTHRLQPCDVGVFGPLASSWKAIVNETSADYVPIRKNNLISHYSRARQKAFSEKTIKSAFRKTGIWPFNQSIIEKDAYAPALNTTTQAALPIAPVIPDLLTHTSPVSSSNSDSNVMDAAVVAAPDAPVRILRSSSRNALMQNSGLPLRRLPFTDVVGQSSSSEMPPTSSGLSPSSNHDAVVIATSADHTDFLGPSRSALDVPEFTIAGLPPAPTQSTSRDSLLAQNLQLRDLLDRACFQMQRDYALKKLMEKENERLRQRLFNKTNKPKKKLYSGNARHMTSDEVLEELAREDWQAAMKEVFKSEIFKQRKNAYEQYCRDRAAQEKETEKARKVAERLEERQRKAQDRLHQQEERKEERERVKAMKEAKKKRTAQATNVQRAVQNHAAARPRRVTKAKVAADLDMIDEEADEMESDQGMPEGAAEVPVAVVVERPHPRPKPRLRTAAPSVAAQIQEMGPVRRRSRRAAPLEHL